jgi:hypothetical protein
MVAPSLSRRALDLGAEIEGLQNLTTFQLLEQGSLAVEQVKAEDTEFTTLVLSVEMTRHAVLAGEEGKRSTWRGDLVRLLRECGRYKQAHTHNEDTFLKTMHGFSNGIVGLCDAAS